VIVVGAGPVGQTLLRCLLARWGVPVVVLDARPARDAVGSKAIVQQRDVIDIWDAVGAGARSRARAPLAHRPHLLPRQGTVRCRSSSTVDGPPFPPFANVSAGPHRGTARRRIAAQPLIEVRWNSRCRWSDQDASCVRVPCAGGTVLRAPHVLVCAGPRC
jgi:2-polyprenyl-6-methoxyphenol hydroxylase-like FAD-dependent oxidoreductase